MCGGPLGSREKSSCNWSKATYLAGLEAGEVAEAPSALSLLSRVPPRGGVEGRVSLRPLLLMSGWLPAANTRDPPPFRAPWVLLSAWIWTWLLWAPMVLAPFLVR